MCLLLCYIQLRGGAQGRLLFLQVRRWLRRTRACLSPFLLHPSRLFPCWWWSGPQAPRSPLTEDQPDTTCFGTLRGSLVLLMKTRGELFSPDSYLLGKVKLADHRERTRHPDLQKLCSVPCKCQVPVCGVGLEMSTDDLGTLKHYAPDCRSQRNCSPPSVQHKAPGRKPTVPAPGCQSTTQVRPVESPRKGRLSGIVWE